MSLLIKALLRNQKTFHSVIPKELQEGKPLCLNLSEDSEFADINIENTEALINRTQEILHQHQADIAIGKYAENRTIYKTRKRFDGVERTVHLGIDLMVPPETPVYTPLAATVHSFKDNCEIGDYGPTIILEHEIENIPFYTLYGHLSRDSLKTLKPGQALTHGQQFATVGTAAENGKWPPHLHFQLITDIGEYSGDFPGVTNIFSQHEFLALCPNPNYLLGLKLPTTRCPHPER